MTDEKSELREEDCEVAEVAVPEDVVRSEEVEDFVEGRLDDEEALEEVVRFRRREIAAGRAGGSSSISASVISAS